VPPSSSRPRVARGRAPAAAAPRRYVLDESIGFLVHRADLALTRTLLALFGRRGVTVEQWMVLARLAEGDGLTQRELARRNGQDPTTLTRILQRMERSGLVERRDDREDARAFRVLLTPKGRRLQAELAPLALSGVPALAAGMSPGDVRELRRLLILLFENVAQRRPAPSPPAVTSRRTS
jgi:DNA-binding MarR family transcriptional regulator